MNPDFDSIGKQFVRAYYHVFDAKQTRADVGFFYHLNNSCLTFEGDQVMGRGGINAKFAQKVTMGNIERDITKLDCQPTCDGGILIHVLGQLKSDGEGDKVMGYTQVFLLKPEGGSMFIINDVFRLALHDFVAQQSE